MKKIVSMLAWIFPGQYIKGVFIRKIEGRENFPKRNFIFAGNHLSHIDWLIDGAILTPRRFTFIGQVDKMTGIKGFLRDMIYWWAEVIPVNRNDKEAKKKTITKALEMLKEGYCLIMYPEGTRSRDGKLHEFKPGLGKLHLESGVPILPVAHIGTYELMPPGEKFKAKKIVKIKIGKLMDFTQEKKMAARLGKDSDEYRKLCDMISKKVQNAVDILLR